MLKHLKRRQYNESSAAGSATAAPIGQKQQVSAGLHSYRQQQQQQQSDQSNTQQAMPKRVRGRRSSKPMMEKRRRARINECLDILKNYVLTDSLNLVEHGIDVASRENHDEDSIARTILKSSGLINRHRGRKNPNKLEKADILELTVDYVRKLHEQRDLWMHKAGEEGRQQDKLLAPLSINIKSTANKHSTSRPYVGLLESLPVHPTPPPSSASSSSSPQPLLSIVSHGPHHMAHEAIPEALDLSDFRRKSYV